MDALCFPRKLLIKPNLYFTEIWIVFTHSVYINNVYVYRHPTDTVTTRCSFCLNMNCSKFPCGGLNECVARVAWHSFLYGILQFNGYYVLFMRLLNEQQVCTIRFPINLLIMEIQTAPAKSTKIKRI